MGKVVKVAAREEQTREAARTQEISATMQELRGQLAAEVSERASSDEELGRRLAGVSEELQAEEERRSHDNTFVIAKLDAETGEIKHNIKVIETGLSEEVATREEEVQKLRWEMSGAIDAEKIARSQEIEDTRRGLLAVLGDEKALQEIESEALRGRLTSETAAMGATLEGLRGQLELEAEARQGADLSLQQAIEAEAGARESSITKMHSELSGYIDEQISSSESITKAYITKKLEEVKEGLNDFTAPTASKAGERGLVPAVPAGMVNGILTTRGWRTPEDATLTIGAIPAQSGVLYYNKKVQKATWQNFDSTKLKLAGSTQGTAAGEYAVTFTPLDIYVWSDTLDQRAKAATWRIEVLSLAKPTAAVTGFNYDGAAKTLNVANYDATYIEQKGIVSATEPGVYQVSYSLKDKNNTAWNDGSNNEIVIEWKIERKELTAAQSTGFAQSGTLTYTGSSQSPTIKNYNSSYHELSGTTAAVDAGSYKVQIAPKSGFVWSDGTSAAKEVSWKIGKRSITKPNASTKAFDYDGNAKTLQVTNYDSSVMVQSGTVTATNAGTYQVSYSLKDKNNTAWSGNSTADVVIEWSIGSKTIAKPTASTVSFTYDGNAKTLVVANYDNKYIEQSGTVTATNAGTYTAIYHLSNSAVVKWSDGTTGDVSITWVIEKAKLGMKASQVYTTTKLIYNGEEQNPTVLRYDSSVHNWSGDAWKVAAGEYESYITPKSNYTWSDGTSDEVTIKWSIGKLLLARPTVVGSDAEATLVEAGVYSFTYSGAAVSWSYNNYNEKYIERSSAVTSLAQVGQVEVTFKLKDKVNTAWQKAGSSTTADGVEDWKVTIKAEVAKITKPTAAVKTFTYDGTTKTLIVSGYDPNVMERKGTYQATDAGRYSIDFTLKDATDTWSDGTTAQVRIIWTIEKAKLSEELSTFEESYSEGYIASAIYAKNVITPFNEDYHNITYLNSSPESSVAICSYTVQITPKKNYAWSDGTTTAKNVTWAITRRSIPKPKRKSTSVYVDGWQVQTYTDKQKRVYLQVRYDGYSVLLGEVPWDRNVEDVLDNVNTEVFEAGLVKRVEEGAAGYGHTHVDTVGVDDEGAAFITAFSRQEPLTQYNEPGWYLAGYTLTDKVNTCWEDGSTDDVLIFWKMLPYRLTTPNVQAAPIVYQGATAKHYPPQSRYSLDMMEKLGVGLMVQSPFNNSRPYIAFNDIPEQYLIENIINYTYNDKVYRCLHCVGFYTISKTTYCWATSSGDFDNFIRMTQPFDFYIALPDDLYPEYPAAKSMLAGNSKSLTARDLDQIQAAVIDLQNAVKDLYQLQNNKTDI